jgi:tetratricopeptide (TPR) repeat protein
LFWQNLMIHLRISLAMLCLALSVSAIAQTPAPSQAASLQKAISLAEKGHCKEALPVLKRNLSRIADKQLKYNAAMAATRCAMSLDDTETIVDSLLLLQRDFPQDPEVLYISTHYFSQLANRSAQRLAQTAPHSAQVQKLNAEALESQGKWNDAISAYRAILQQYPKEPEVHYRIARILLDQSATPDATEKAKGELEEELAVNPKNAAAEFILGEIARRAADWDVAVKHFERASELDAGFSEAYLAKGMSLAGAGKFPEAIPPLEKYVKMQPEDPAGHYQLAIAYSRTGNKPAAEREMELQKKAAQHTSLERAPTAPAPQ